MPALNIAEIQTNKESVKAFKTAYTDKLSSYRDDYPDYSFYKFDNEIFAWNHNLTQIELPQEFNNVVISKKEQTLVFKEILEQGIVHFFKSKNQDIYRRKYSSIWNVNLSKDNKILFNGLSLNPQLEFQINPLYSTQQDTQVISISIRKTYKPVFTYSDSEFKTNNIDTRNWDKNDKDELIFSPKNRALRCYKSRLMNIKVRFLRHTVYSKNLRNLVAYSKRFSNIHLKFSSQMT